MKPKVKRDITAPARKFLRDILWNGPVPQSTVIERGAAEGFSVHQLRYAGKIMGVFRLKEEHNSPVRLWCLPQHVPAG